MKKHKNSLILKKNGVQLDKDVFKEAAVNTAIKLIDMQLKTKGITWEEYIELIKIKYKKELDNKE